MILPREKTLSEDQLKEVTDIVESFNCSLQTIIGTERSIYAILGDETSETMVNRLEGLAYIDRVDRIQNQNKLMHRSSELSRHKIRIGGVTLGEELLVIAGQCTVDPKNPNLFIETAHAVKEAGAKVLRGGVWKPRTTPHSFQGDNSSIETVLEARAQTGLPVNIEVMDEDQLAIAMDAKVDMVQIGTRNALNYSLLKKIGKATKDNGTLVLLKRSLHMGKPSEFISAAEYIVAGGNPNVLLCPRGTAPGLDGYRNHPDESITPLLKEQTWAPVVVDPSHSVGRAIYVPFCAAAAIAYGADGVCIESHIRPQEGIGDDPKQSLTPDVLKDLIAELGSLWSLKNKFHRPYQVFT
jgi:3-deoxy-7-phosphoheptulonate synthase